MNIKLFLFLISVSVVPYSLLKVYLPWEIPHLHFFFLGILVIIRIIFFQEEIYKKNLKAVARGELQKKIGRVPSDSEIIDFVESRMKGRGVAFIAAFVLTISSFILIG